MVQQTSYAQEVEELLEHQEISSNSSLKTLHPFIDQEGILRVGGRLQQSGLPYQTMHQMILPPNHQFTKLVVSAEHWTSSCWATTSDCITLGEILDPNKKKHGENSNSPLLNLLQIHGAGITTAHR
jgi:hypothetical protein